MLAAGAAGSAFGRLHGLSSVLLLLVSFARGSLGDGDSEHSGAPPQATTKGATTINPTMKRMARTMRSAAALRH